MARAGIRGVAAAVLLAGALLAGCAQDTTGRGSTAPAAPASPEPSNRPMPATAPAAHQPAAESARRQPAARPQRTRCTGNTLAQLVIVSVPRQHVWMCARGRLVYHAPITTGAVELPYKATPTGRFQVQAKASGQTLTLLSGAQYQVQYWIPFDAPLFGFHDSTWQDFPYGSQRYRTEGSNGCIHVPLPAMAFLYNWAQIGTTVDIRG